MSRVVAEDVTVTVERVGAQGDGIALHRGRPVYIPFTAPGDSVRVRLGARRGEGQAADLLELVSPGPRATPACRHFGRCGGCALQHLPPDIYRGSKEGQIAAALAQHGLKAPIEPLRLIAPGTRRRARVAIKRPRRGPVVVGFAARRSHDAVDMRDCPVLHPSLLAVIAPLREAAPQWWSPGQSGAATMTLAEGGVDLLLELAAVPDLSSLESLAGFAAVQDLLRLAWHRGETEEPVPVAIRRPPRVRLSGIAVDLPFDAFLQASAEAEAALVEQVIAACGNAARCVDLFAGLGTFSFALAARGRVHAVEGVRPALNALLRAAERAGLAGRVTGELRDLEAHPLSPDDLARLEADVVVLDPPRVGARAQSAALAATRLARIVYVSCNPASFARDARNLVDGGYRLERIQPIDQFVWSSEVELVAHFVHRTRQVASPKGASRAGSFTSS